MNYYGSKELAASFRTVRGNTVKIAEDIPEDKYSFRASPDTRTLAQMLVHIALSPGFGLHIHSNRISDLSKVNFPELFQQFSAEEAKPRSKGEIIALLKSEGEKVATFLDSLSDAFLAETVSRMPGESATRTRFEMLLSTKEHEMHHRAQLMLIERLLGMVPHLTREREQRMAAAQAGRR